MLDKILQTILKKYCGEFLTGIQNIELGVWSGKINLQNTSLKHQKINQYLKANNIPLFIKYSYIGSFQIDIPWNKLSSVPVQVKINQIYIVLNLNKIHSVDDKIVQQKLSLIKNYVQQLIKKSLLQSSEQQQAKQSSYTKKLIMKIVNNLNFQINNISIRVESDEQCFNDTKQQIEQTSSKISQKVSAINSQNSRSNSQFSEIKKKKKPFAFGICIKTFNSDTIDEHNNRTYYNLQSSKSPLFKIMKMDGISIYWEQKNQLDLFKHNLEQKNQLLNSLITRETNRLLTISGNLHMKKNIQNLDYLFQTDFENINISGTYRQLEGIIRVYSNFKLAAKSKQILTMSQMKQTQQLSLKETFQKQFDKQYLNNFQNAKHNPVFIKLLKGISKKNLLCWSRDNTIKIIQNTKVEQLRQQKNRKGFFGFLAAKAEIDLTEQEYQKIMKEVQRIIQQIQSKKMQSIKIGFSLKISKLFIYIDHEDMKQNISLNFQQTYFKYIRKAKDQKQLEFKISDISLLYSNLALNTQTYLLSSYKKQQQKLVNNEHLIYLNMLNTSKQVHFKISIQQLQINHQSKILILISELLKLKERQQMNSDVTPKKLQLKWSQKQGQMGPQKDQVEYNINFQMKTLHIIVQVSQNSYLRAILNSSYIKTHNYNHLGTINQFSLNYVRGSASVSPIINNFSANLQFSNNLSKMDFQASKLYVYVCQDDMYYIYKNFKKQFSIFSNQKIQHKNFRIEQNTIMQGELKTMTIFKDWRKYYAKLTEDSLYFYNPAEQNQTIEPEKPINIIPLKDTSVEQVTDCRFKIESSQINQLIQCNHQICDAWVAAIQKVIFDCSSRQKLFSIINGQQKKSETYEKSLYNFQIKILSEGFSILFSQTIGRDITLIQASQINIILRENDIEFNRQFSIEQFFIKNCLAQNQSYLSKLIDINPQNINKPLQANFIGKKKLHPEYKGQLVININLPAIRINYDAQYLYKLIKKISWTYQIPSYTKQMRDTKVLQFTQKYLKSKECQILTERITTSNSIEEDYAEFMEINNFKKYNTANVLLKIQAIINDVEVNMMNGKNNICIFEAKAEQLSVQIDKGTTFFFLKLKSKKFVLSDATNYPNTLSKPWYKPQKLYPIIFLQKQRNFQDCLVCTFSRFSLERFLNKDRLKSIFGLHLYDIEANYQNQIILRFVDYLLNQIIGFLMAPHQLHKYDGPVRGPFKYYDYLDMTQNQVKSIIQSCIHPFFTKLIIKASNFKANFNSHPTQQCIPIIMDDIKFQSHHYINPDRIKFNNTQLQKIQKNDQFKYLIEIQDFQQKILKNHWGCKFGIIATGCKSFIFQNQFELSLVIDRAVLSQKQIIFPFVTIDTGINCKSWIQNLSIKAPKQVYNLINRCIMHNVSYDDQCDKYFYSNFQFRDLMVSNQIYYSLKAKQLSIVIPELDLVIAIPDFEYIFLKHSSNMKQMYVYGKSLNILGEQQCLITPSDHLLDQQNIRNEKMRKQSSIGDSHCEGYPKGLQYFIQMQTDGTKIMSVILRTIQITYNLDTFMKLLNYFLLDQSCYPAPLDFNDLPRIVCDVRLKKTFLKLLKVQDLKGNGENSQTLTNYQYIGVGDINLVWIRNKVIHPELYERDRSLFPSGAEWCSYTIYVKNFLLRKYTIFENIANKNSYLSYNSSTKKMKKNYRALSHPISLVITISQLMKMAPNGQKYNDNVFGVKISSLLLRICYKDIQQIINYLQNNPKKTDESQKKQTQAQEQIQEMQQIVQNQEPSNYEFQSQQQQIELLPQQQSSKVSYTKYTIDIKKFSINMGLSELPVPILDLTVKNANIVIQMFNNSKNLAFDGSILALYWNMLIGKWQTIIERFVPKVNLRFQSPKKTFIIQCYQPFLANLSMEALKVLSILYADINQKGNFSFIKKNHSSSIEPRGNHVSPYILTNKTGFPIIVSSQLVYAIQLNSDEKMYIEVQSFQIQRQQTQQIIFQIDSRPKKSQQNLIQSDYGWCEKQIRLDEAVTKKILIRSANNRAYHLYEKIISTPIMKQIIIASPYQIQNLTQFTFIFFYDKYKIKVEPGQKLALNFMANMKKRNLKISFPFLENLMEKNSNFRSSKQSENKKVIKKSAKNRVIQNYQFPFDVLYNGYEHQILLDDNSTFNVVISIDQDPEIIITVQPAFYVKNLLPFQLPVDFTIINEAQQKCLCSYHLQINQQKMIYDFNSLSDNKIDDKNFKINDQKQIKVRLKVHGFNVSPFQSIADPLKPFEYKNSLDLIDYRGNEGKISMKVLKDGKVRRIYFYSEAVLINQTKFNWFVFINNNKFLSGQPLKDNFSQLLSPYLLINQGNISNYSEKTNNKNQSIVIRFGFRQMSADSNQISVTQIGLQQVKVIKGSALYQFTIKNTLTELDTIGKIYSNILKAQPKYVVVNQTDLYLLISQNKVFTKVFEIKPNQRLPWMWPNKSEQKKVVLKLIENQMQIPGDSQEWDYSSQINFEEIEQQIIVLRPKSNCSSRKLIQIIPIHQHQSTFIVIREVKKTQEALIIIKNQLKFNRVAVYQQIVDKKNPIWANNKHFQVQPCSKVPFGWDYPNAPQNIVLLFTFLGYMRSQYQPFELRIDTSVQRTIEARTINIDNQVYEILVQIQIFGLKKVITFLKKDLASIQQQQEQFMQGGGKIALNFLEIGVSIIGKSNQLNRRAQVMFLHLKKLQLIIMEKKTSKTFQLRIKYINIDNNMYRNTIYPIMLTPLRHQKTLNKSRPFFVMILEQTIGDQGQIKQIKQMRICLQPVSLKIQDEILVAFFDVVKVIGKIGYDEKDQVDLISIYRAYTHKMQWQNIKLYKPTSDIFIRELQIARLALQITFSIRPKFNRQNFIITTILSSFGVAISNVSEAQLTLSRFSRKDAYFSQIKHQLMDFYLKQFIKGIYKVLGSINLFGNPYVLIRMFAEGTWQIINQPTEGFIKGPIEGGYGIVKGGVFFTRNLVAGVCNSFEAISESISRGVASMTMDQKFIQRRQKIKIQKSAHLIKGVQHGGFAIYTGFQVAVTGLVRHPQQDYKNKGFIGGCTGTLKGVAGLVTKPISGTFQGISKLSEGIKNTALLFQDGPNSKRIRPPRIFVTQLQHYKPYNYLDSLAVSILQNASTKHLNSKILYIYSYIDHHHEKQQSHVLTDKFFSKIDLKEQKVLQDFELAQISGMALHENTLIMKIQGGMSLAISVGNIKDLYSAFKKYTHNQQ